jgi:hypothetical protein
MPPKEAHARIRINKLLEEAGWRFLDDGKNPASIVLEAKHPLVGNALHDPNSREIGKTILFAVSQNHAAKLNPLLNELVHERFQSDFAMQRRIVAELEQERVWGDSEYQKS